MGTEPRGTGRLPPADSLGEPTKVACNGCTLCCRREVVLLVPGDNPLDYPGLVTIDAPDPYSDAPVTKMLPHRDDGSCAYLGMHGCTIYDRRPMMCRVFSCVGYVRRALATKSKGEIRRAVRSHAIDPEVWEAGMKRLNDG